MINLKIFRKDMNKRVVFKSTEAHFTQSKLTNGSKLSYVVNYKKKNIK